MEINIKNLWFSLFIDDKVLLKSNLHGLISSLIPTLGNFSYFRFYGGTKKSNSKLHQCSNKSNDKIFLGLQIIKMNLPNDVSYES